MGCYDYLPKGSQVKCWDCDFSEIREGSRVQLLSPTEHVVILKKGGFVKVSAQGLVLEIVEDKTPRKASDFPGYVCFDKWGNPWQDDTYEVDESGFMCKGMSKKKSSMKSKLPPLTQQPILHVDGTPDEGYVLRILQAYRQNCNCRWASDTDGGAVEKNPLLKAMNEAEDKRAELLDKAIKLLEEA